MFPLNVAAAVTNPVRAVISPSGVSGNSPNFPITTSLATCTTSGGYPPYTYAWTKVSGPATSVANTSSQAGTTFTATAGVAPEDTAEEVWRCTVTDDLNQTVFDDVNVTFTRFGGGPV